MDTKVLLFTARCCGFVDYKLDCPIASFLLPWSHDFQMATRLFLIRHGATILSAEDRFAGETDIPLSDEGREQARKLGLRLGGDPIRAAYASPLGRTMETARLVVAPHAIEVERCDGLREISHGRWEQKT